MKVEGVENATGRKNLCCQEAGRKHPVTWAASGMTKLANANSRLERDRNAQNR